jgi:chromosome segregation ATPase
MTDDREREVLEPIARKFRELAGQPEPVDQLAVLVAQVRQELNGCAFHDLQDDDPHLVAVGLLRQIGTALEEAQADRRAIEKAFAGFLALATSCAEGIMELKDERDRLEDALAHNERERAKDLARIAELKEQVEELEGQVGELELELDEAKTPGAGHA